MAKIQSILAREIFDSRGNPTIKTRVTLEDGSVGCSSVPSGASIGTSEAVELRDNDTNRFDGKGVLKAVDNVNTLISKTILGMESLDQSAIDRAMIALDGTPNKANLGANSILSVSQAVVKASAASLKMTLSSYIRQFVNVDTQKIPIPIFNLIEGGKHANNLLDFQELLVIPASTKSYTESLEIGVRVYQSLKKVITDKGLETLVADEGGFSPEIGNNHAALTFLKESIEASGVPFSLEVFIGLDVAANTLHDGKLYRLIDKPNPYSTQDLLNFYQELFSEFSLIYIEDPYSENDLDGWKKIYEALGEKTLIVGDDLTTTNPLKLAQALESKLIGGIIIKPNQIGTVTETIAVAEIAHIKNLKIIVSHRSGETEDTFIADFAVGIGADYAKFGAPARERMAKYNRLLDIEQDLASK